MLPAYKESCTEFISRKNKISEHKKQLIFQKLLGCLLVLGGIAGMVVIPEDCGACIITALMGVARIIYN